MIFKPDELYETIKQDCIKKGEIKYSPTSKANEKENNTDSKNVYENEPYKHMTIEEKLATLQQEREKLELYLANKEKIDAHYAYMKEYVQVQVENQTLNQTSPIDIDNLSLEELKNLLIQIQGLQPKEEAKAPKTNFMKKRYTDL